MENNQAPKKSGKGPVVATIGVVVLLALIIFISLRAYNTLSEANKSKSLIGVNNSTTEAAPPEQPTQAPPQEEPAETEPAPMLSPDITFYDLEGNSHSLSELRGKPVVINFWASWCPPCKHEMPFFDSVYNELGEDINFVMLNMTDGKEETLETASKFIANNSYAFPVYYDTDQSGMITYQVSSLPTTYFINSEGYLVTGAIGAIDEETLRLGIDMTLESDAKANE